jgi:hypothetical protein
VCEQCALGIAVLGPQPPDIPTDAYARTVREVARVAAMLPQRYGEPARSWTTRVAIAFQSVRAGNPISEFLKSPLPESAIVMFERGYTNVAHVERVTKPPPRLKVPEKSANAQVEKRHRAAPKAGGGLKIW